MVSEGGSIPLSPSAVLNNVVLGAAAARADVARAAAVLSPSAGSSVCAAVLGAAPVPLAVLLAVLLTVLARSISLAVLAVWHA